MIFRIVDRNFKVLSEVESQWFGLESNIIETYKSKFNLDIGSYGLDEWEFDSEVDCFSLIIRDEDLIYLRNLKLNELLDFKK